MVKILRKYSKNAVLLWLNFTALLNSCPTVAHSNSVWINNNVCFVLLIMWYHFERSTFSIRGLLNELKCTAILKLSLKRLLNCASIKRQTIGKGSRAVTRAAVQSYNEKTKKWIPGGHLNSLEEPAYSLYTIREKKSKIEWMYVLGIFNLYFWVTSYNSLLDFY